MLKCYFSIDHRSLLFLGIFYQRDSRVKRITELSLLKEEYKDELHANEGRLHPPPVSLLPTSGEVKTLKFYTSPRRIRYDKKTAEFWAKALCVDGATDS
jgi:hypothetical protein